MIECDGCREKTGSPDLCAGCQEHRRFESEIDCLLAEVRQARLERDAAITSCNKNANVIGEIAETNRKMWKRIESLMKEREDLRVFVRSVADRAEDRLGEMPTIPDAREAFAYWLRYIAERARKQLGEQV